MIVTIGDLLLDVIVRLSQPLAEGADADAVTQLGPGGQAANVAAWVSELGGRRPLRGQARRRRSGRAPPPPGWSATASRCAAPSSRAGPARSSRSSRSTANRTMASDRGVSPDLRADRARPGAGSSTSGSICPATRSCAPRSTTRRSWAAALAPDVSVDLSSWSAIRDFGPERFRERLEQLEPAVVFANEEEEEILGGPLPDTTWIVKRGAAGARFGDDELPARNADVVDTTGAGDALAAGYLVGGPELALEAAARCVAKLGSMP